MPIHRVGKRGTEDAFRFHHGRLSLSFVGTVGDRGSQPNERVPSPVALGAWLRAANLAPDGIAPTAAQYRKAIELREAIARIARAVMEGRRAMVADVGIVNAVAGRASSRIELDPRSLTIRHAASDTIDATFGRIARDAIELFGDADERARLRSCGAGECAAIFLTPAGRRERRWCSMALCGNRAKVAAFRSRA